MPNREPQRPPPYALDRDILEREVEIEFFRASGPGGQHVNKTQSALRLTHWPSGAVVIAQDSPSQHRNREIAFERLIARLEKLNYVPKKRRLEGKKQVGEKKRTRGRVQDD